MYKLNENHWKTVYESLDKDVPVSIRCTSIAVPLNLGGSSKDVWRLEDGRTVIGVGLRGLGAPFFTPIFELTQEQLDALTEPLTIGRVTTTEYLDNTITDFEINGIHIDLESWEGLYPDMERPLTRSEIKENKENGIYGAEYRKDRSKVLDKRARNRKKRKRKKRK